jgi:hypothetical protein
MPCHDDLVRELSLATGRDLAYHDVPPALARVAMAGRGMPEWLADAMAESMVDAGRGREVSVTDLVRKITGLEPRAFAAWARENVRAFARVRLMKSKSECDLGHVPG